MRRYPCSLDAREVCLGHPPCGHDGCGGQCGVCPDSEECVDNQCVWRTFEHRFAPKDEREAPDGAI